MLKRAKVVGFVKKNWILFLLIGFLTSAEIVMFVTYFAPREEPYFISIECDDDFERWCEVGNGTAENPYIIEGHHITIPEWYSEEIPLISVIDVTKNFIIQKNVLDLDKSPRIVNYPMIFINHAQASYVIRENVISSKYCCISAPDGLFLGSVVANSVVANNTFENTCVKTNYAENILIYNNTFKKPFPFTAYAAQLAIYESENITLCNNLFLNCELDLRYSSNISVMRNNFIFNEVETAILASSLIPNLVFINNSFLFGGVKISSSCYPTAKIEGNIINGKILGIFIDQHDFEINDSLAYGQIDLINCSNILIVDQAMVNISTPVTLENCLNVTIANCTFIRNDQNALGIYYSNNTIILDNYFEDSINTISIYYSNYTVIKYNTFQAVSGYLYSYPSGLVIVVEDNVFE